MIERRHQGRTIESLPERSSKDHQLLSLSQLDLWRADWTSQKSTGRDFGLSVTIKSLRKFSYLSSQMDITEEVNASKVARPI